MQTSADEEQNDGSMRARKIQETLKTRAGRWITDSGQLFTDIMVQTGYYSVSSCIKLNDY